MFFSNGSFMDVYYTPTSYPARMDGKWGGGQKMKTRQVNVSTPDTAEMDS
jgi:hypothetical protein